MRRHLPLYAIALAILIVGARAFGVPARSVAFGLLALACPLIDAARRPRWSRQALRSRRAATLAWADLGGEVIR